MHLLPHILLPSVTVEIRFGDSTGTGNLRARLFDVNSRRCCKSERCIRRKSVALNKEFEFE